MEFLHKYWEMLTSGVVVAFMFGGLYNVQNEHKKKIDKLEELLTTDIPEIKETLARIDERTKKL